MSLEMLETLRIENYALIEQAELEFQPGFNVLTGETGAGKSIIVGALTLVLGARAASDVVRKGAKRATIDAVFRLKQPSSRLQALLEAHEIELDDGELILSRSISAEGRSRAYCGGKIVPLHVLAQIGDELVDMHGQHEHQSLLKAERQLDLLDAYGGTEKLADEVATGVRELRELERSIREWEADDRERARKLEFLRFELNEIDKAGLQPGEEGELRQRRNLLTNAETIAETAATAYEALYEHPQGTAAMDTLGLAGQAIEQLADLDPRFQPMLGQVRDLEAALESLAQDVRGHTELSEWDPAELDQLNQRLSLISDLKRKYGETIEAILSYREQICSELTQHENRDEHLANLRRRHDELTQRLESKARELSKKRKSAAKRLDKEVTASLQELEMKGGRFETRFEASELTLHGMDKVRFLLAANPGETLKPLRQVASGGEISRIMLAIKSVFASADTIPTLIFDEIDAGVGGMVAHKVAGKLDRLAQSHQILCITHLPQIAAAAGNHYHVAKRTVKGRTTTKASRVESETRVKEIARLLDGSVSTLSVEHARELLNSA